MAKDPYKYFRVEARELIDGLSAGVLELERAVAPEVVARLLRLAHTLKGAARVVKQPAIADIAHTVESVLGEHRASGAVLARDGASALLRHIDAMAALLAALDPAEPKTVKAVKVPGVIEETLDTVRVDIHAMDALAHGLDDTTARVSALRRELASVERLRDLGRLLSVKLAPVDGATRALAEQLRGETERLLRSVTNGVEHVESGLSELQDASQRLRLVPAHTVFSQLERAVRDAAAALGKEVDFQASGGDVRLDAQVLASLRDAMMHVVRNAVTHGIEEPAARRASGKPASGRVRLVVERRGGRVAFVCSDDGAGVDIDAVRRVAVERGLLSSDDAASVSAERAIALLSGGGLTTTRGVTELSGRGIGLDVVRTTTTQLRGEMHIRSEPKQGATFEIVVPVSIASLQGLVVEMDGVAAAIPLDAIRQTLRIEAADIARSSDSGSIVHGGKVIPFVPLDSALRRASPAGRRRHVWSAVVVEAAGGGVALGVDRLLGTSTIVMRALPDAVLADPVVAGASLDTDGNPRLVLDPIGLVRAGTKPSTFAGELKTPQRLPILIIDDSLTTRMLEQSILESAGYTVELATSAEEGLVKARERSYCLFVVDVEMPGMDGFGFVAATQEDAALRGIPAILVTSRNAPEDKRRGAQVGARAYIVKGEFDQGHLLSAIRRLVT